MNDPTFWIAARVTGIVAYLLMAATMLAGLTLAGRARPTWAKPADTMALHRTLSAAALGVAGLHGVALVLDRTVDIPVQALLVPGLVPYRPLWTGLGVVAAWLAVTVHLSFRVRARMGTRAWRRLHMTTYGAFLLASAHGLAAGTDSARPWMVGVYGAAVGAVAGATAWRVGLERSTRRRRTGEAAA